MVRVFRISEKTNKNSTACAEEALSKNIDVVDNRNGNAFKRSGNSKKVMLDVSKVDIQTANTNVIGSVKENFPGFFDLPERCKIFESTTAPQKEIWKQETEGFPPILDLTSLIDLETDDTDELSKLDNPNEKFDSNSDKTTCLFLQALNNHPKICDYQLHPTSSKVITKEKDTLISSIISNIELIDAEIQATDIIPSRLAAEQIHTDLATKCIKNLYSRQEQHLTHLFDTLINGSLNTPSTSKDTTYKNLYDFACQRIESIKALYLEEIFNEETQQKTLQFGSSVNPLKDRGWMLSPIRRVLDAVQQRSSNVANDDDIEIVTLALLWSIMVMKEQPMLFGMVTEPDDFYCRIAEIFLIGEDVFKNEIIQKCLIYALDYLVNMGLKEMLKFQLNKPLAGLDAFMPFYEDLMQRFEETSFGDENYSLVLLIPLYLNTSTGDALFASQQLWSLHRRIVRLMTLSKKRAEPLINYVRHSIKHNNQPNSELRIYTEYTKLLALYAAAIRDDAITAERNPALYEIASLELGSFARNPSKVSDNSDKGHEKQNERNILIDLLRKTVSGKLSI